MVNQDDFVSGVWKMIAACILLAVLILGCSSNSPTPESPMDESTTHTEPVDELASKLLSGQEYADAVLHDMEKLLADNGLIIFRTDTRIPYLQFYVEPGIMQEDGTYLPHGLEQAEYEKIIGRVKHAVPLILDKYRYEKKFLNMFSAPPNTVIGVTFENRFIYRDHVKQTVERYPVSEFQLDIDCYYFPDDFGNSPEYIILDVYGPGVWDAYEVYTGE